MDPFADHLHMSDRENKPCGNAEIPGEGGVSTGTEASAYALLTDGTTIEIRPARPGDFDAVRAMHTKMSPDNLYLRFFSFSICAFSASVSALFQLQRSRGRAGSAPDLPRARTGPRRAAGRAGRGSGRLQQLRVC